MKHSVSFVTINLNNANGLTDTITSYLRLLKLVDSNRTSLELIVIDGASSDGSLGVLHEHAKTIDKSVSEPDSGIYNAMQKGVNLATKQFICFMNSGDVISPDGMLHLIEIARNTSDAHSGHPLWSTKVREFPFAKYCPLLLRMPNHQCMLIPRQFVLDHPFDLRFPIAADLDQKLALHRAGLLRYHSISTTICDGNGVSRTIDDLSSLAQRAKEQATVALKHYGFFMAAINYLFFIGWHLPKTFCGNKGK